MPRQAKVATTDQVRSLTCADLPIGRQEADASAIARAAGLWRWGWQADGQRHPLGVRAMRSQLLGIVIAAVAAAAIAACDLTWSSTYASSCSAHMERAVDLNDAGEVVGWRGPCLRQVEVALAEFEQVDRQAIGEFLLRRDSNAHS